MDNHIWTEVPFHKPDVDHGQSMVITKFTMINHGSTYVDHAIMVDVSIGSGFWEDRNIISGYKQLVMLALVNLDQKLERKKRRKMWRKNCLREKLRPCVQIVNRLWVTMCSGCADYSRELLLSSSNHKHWCELHMFLVTSCDKCHFWVYQLQPCKK